MSKFNKSKTPENEKDLAQTPLWFVESLTNLLGIRAFNLDVCALEKTKKANDCYSLSERGENCLDLPWGKWNWCNPPFSNIMPFIEKAIEQAGHGNCTAMIMPNNPETAYIRHAKEWADTIIEMPFRIKFQKPDGEKFVDKNGREQSPQFSCLVAVFTPLGLKRETAYMYYDFRNGFYAK